MNSCEFHKLKTPIAFDCILKWSLTLFLFSSPSSFCNPSPLFSTSYLLYSPPRFLPFHPAAHRPRWVPYSYPWPGLALGRGRRKRRERGREVLLPVWSLVQQPADGPAALRGQETPQERSPSAPPGAASGQSGCHGEHRSASWPRARHKWQVKGRRGVKTLYEERR